MELLPLKADGKTAYGDWVIPKAWDAASATLRMGDKNGKILADYKAIPCSLIQYSASIPNSGVEADVVLVDDPNVIFRNFNGHVEIE